MDTWNLALGVITTVATVGALVFAIWRWIDGRREHRQAEVRGGTKRLPPKRRWWPLTMLLVILAASAIFFWTRPRAAVDKSKYGFEESTMAWVAQTYPTDVGVAEIARTKERARFGGHSLQMRADLEGGHPSRSKGEAYVELDSPQNLEGKPITAWVYVPAEAIGEPQRPNGIQVFVKDIEWRGQYGTWWAIRPGRVDAWHQVALTPSRTEPTDGYMAPGFDPTQIRAIGVKVGIGEGSSAQYRGPVYVDAVSWPH